MQWAGMTADIAGALIKLIIFGCLLSAVVATRGSLAARKVKRGSLASARIPRDPEGGHWMRYVEGDIVTGWLLGSDRGDPGLNRVINTIDIDPSGAARLGWPPNRTLYIRLLAPRDECV
jgi:hypothetical protein